MVWVTIAGDEAFESRRCRTPGHDGQQQRDQGAGDGNAGVHHPLEDLMDHMFLGDMTGQRIADALDVAFESLHFRALIIDFRPS